MTRTTVTVTSPLLDHRHPAEAAAFGEASPIGGAPMTYTRPEAPPAPDPEPAPEPAPEPEPEPEE